MNRRTFLFTGGSVLLGQALSGCGSQQSQLLAIQLLQSSMPPQVIKAFLRQPQVNGVAKLKLTPSPSPRELYQRLESWKTPQTSVDSSSWSFPWQKEAAPPQLVSLGDYWLTSAIAQNFLQPIAIDQIPNWSSLPQAWKQVAQRDNRGLRSPQGQVWGVPYRWGATAIAYRRDKFQKLGWQPTDWSDLWRSELAGQISLLDQPREVIGLTLKSLGKPYNGDAVLTEREWESLQQKLEQLHRQTRFYSSTAYLQPLTLGDTWLAVGWTADIILAMEQNADIEIVIPKSGTALWTDLWVRPKTAETSPWITPWLDFCLQPETLQQIAQFSQGGTWIENQPLNPLIGESALWIDPVILNRCEFLYPLPPAIAERYQQLWQGIRIPLTTS